MEPFEEFESNIGFGKERTSSQQSGNSASGTVEEPISPANEQTWRPTEKEKVAMLTETDRIMNDVKSHTQTFNERIDNMQEYGINPGLQTKEGKMIFNPESGKLEKTFLTPAGNRYYSKSLADMESFQYRQAADMSIGGQLRKANLRLQELKAKQEERASEVHKEWAEETENNKAPLAAILGAATYTPRQQSDKENRALSVAIRETEELIKNLEEQKDRENGVDVGFWRGFGRTMGDVRTWDFGMGDMRDAFTMMNADELKKENATEGEREAHDAMMGAIHEKQQAEERYSGNADFWNRAGVMTGYMPSFMLDFVLTGGGFNGLSSFSKGSTRLATKVISKETAEKWLSRVSSPISKKMEPKVWDGMQPTGPSKHSVQLQMICLYALHLWPIQYRQGKLLLTLLTVNWVMWLLMRTATMIFQRQDLGGCHLAK